MNEESLKCVEDYIVRFEKEGPRYWVLKFHMEEKLKLENEEIAQVQDQAQTEALAFNVSLSKEQMCIHLPEKITEQKTEGNDELIRICDFISNTMIWHES